MLRPSPRSGAQPGELLDRGIDLAITIGVVVLILVGFVTSYRTLLDLAVTAGGYPSWLAPAVPLSFDLGIVVLSLKVARAAREGRSAPVLRLLVAGLSAATVLANASVANIGPAKLLHAVPPAMFVVCFESAIITARRRAFSDQNLLPPPLPRLRPAQWMLAPESTWRLWRSQILASFDDNSAARSAREGVSAEASPHNTLPLLADPTESPSAFASVRRGDVVVEVFQSTPTITAADLRVELGRQGHGISLRTAQRLLADARKAAVD